ncbi:hypothetical protein [Streptomyces sp. A30]|uniref:hypothetical protein n=1 Tax=Streptomyces sp. A30 TaxID=2789273 RepID=UPI00398076E8
MNFEHPAVRTVEGFDTFDLTGDLVVDLGLTTVFSIHNSVHSTPACRAAGWWPYFRGAREAGPTSADDGPAERAPGLHSL